MKNTYPTEVVARAEYEISIFERPAVDTSIELIAEVKHLRQIIEGLTNAIYNLDDNGCGCIGLDHARQLADDADKHLANRKDA